MSSHILYSLLHAEEKAKFLFSEIEKQNLLIAGKTEEQINTEIYQLAKKTLNIDKYWHKRIVRSGKNTLCLYNENPENLTVTDDDTIFLDFGPLFDKWEADFGRTYVLGHDPEKHKIVKDISILWKTCRDFYFTNPDITGAEYYKYIVSETTKMGWKFQAEYAGHLIGNFPHEHIEGEDPTNYIHPQNDLLMTAKGKQGNDRFWILEMHIRHPEKNFGAFYEQILI